MSDYSEEGFDDEGAMDMDDDNVKEDEVDEVPTKYT